jgi:hypothetical protein
MASMSTTARAVGKWSLRVFLALSALAALYVGVIVFPTPLFAHEARFGEYRVYSDEPIPTEFGRVIDDAARRVGAMEHEPYRAAPRIYLCNSRKRYDLFASLLRMNPESLAIGLSAPNEMFVSMSRVREFAEMNRGRLRHTRFEGNPAEVIAHEIAHFNSVRALGFREHVAQPVWKSEGWAEYQANLSAIHDDPDYDLAERIQRLLDDHYWGDKHGVARNMWEWQILVEFLGEVRGYRLSDLSRDEVTQSSARDQMMDWYQNRPDLGRLGKGDTLLFHPK